MNLKIKEWIKTAHEHHTIQVVDIQKYHLGIILTAIAWILVAQYTSVLEKVNNRPIGTVRSFVELGIEMSILHLTMLCVYSFFIYLQGKDYFRCKNTLGVVWRGIVAYISFLTYSLAKIDSSTIDNTILYGLDAIWLILIMSWIGIKIEKSQKIIMLIGVTALLFVFKEDLFDHSILSWIYGTTSGLTLAIITLMTSYLIKRDPPLRIGIYHSIIGSIASIAFTLFFIFFEGMPTQILIDPPFMIFSGLIFSIALFCFLEAFYYSEAYVIGVTSLILPIFLIWNEWLIDRESYNLPTLIGTIITAISSLYVFFAEFKETKKHKHFVDGSVKSNHS